MKILKSVLIICALFSISVLTSCKNASQSNAKSSTEQQGKEYTSAYICPMHCDGSGSEKPGDCPVCGMAYEKNKDHNGHNHDHDHDHDHSGHGH